MKKISHCELNLIDTIQRKKYLVSCLNIVEWMCFVKCLYMVVFVSLHIGKFELSTCFISFGQVSLNLYNRTFTPRLITWPQGVFVLWVSRCDLCDPTSTLYSYSTAVSLVFSPSTIPCFHFFILMVCAAYSYINQRVIAS